MEKLRTLVASIKFLRWLPLYEREKPFNIFIDVPDDATDKRTNNLVFEDCLTAIQDVRGQEDFFRLDKNGFMFLTYDIDFDAFENRRLVEENYLPEVERLIHRNVEGVDKIHIFDWRVRISKNPFCV